MPIILCNVPTFNIFNIYVGTWFAPINWFGNHWLTSIKYPMLYPVYIIFWYFILINLYQKYLCFLFYLVLKFKNKCTHLTTDIILIGDLQGPWPRLGWFYMLVANVSQDPWFDRPVCPEGNRLSAEVVAAHCYGHYFYFQRKNVLSGNAEEIVCTYIHS